MRRRARIMLFLLITGNSLFAQHVNTLYLMHSLPQSNHLNPAVQIPCKLYIGIPALSDIEVHVGNSAYSYNDLITIQSDGTPAVNYANLLKHKMRTDLLHTDIQINDLSVGYRYAEYYFTFDVSERIDGLVTWPNSVLQLATGGNTQFVGDDVNLGNFRINLNYYREWAIGVSRVINDKLTLGLRGKLLFGKANLTTTISSVNFYTAPEMFELTMDGDIRANSSFPLNVTKDVNNQVTGVEMGDINIVSFLLNRRNIGAGVDLGAIYILDEKTTLAASILDLGLIRWKSDVNNFHASAAQQINGINFNTQNQLNSLIDTLINGSDITSTTNPYFDVLSPKIYVGGTYQFHRLANVGLMNRSEIFRNKFHSSFTASINALFFRYLSATLSYSWMYNSFANVGLGLGYRTPNFGFFMMSDNVYGMIKWKSARVENLRFGFYLMFGCSKKSKAEGSGRSRSGGLRSSSPNAGKSINPSDYKYLKNTVNGKGCKWIEEREEKERRRLSK